MVVELQAAMHLMSTMSTQLPYADSCEGHMLQLLPIILAAGQLVLPMLLLLLLGSKCTVAAQPWGAPHPWELESKSSAVPLT
jgi:hypothetical protein